MFLPVIVTIEIALAATVAFGTSRWRTPIGKIVAIVASLLFLCVLAFVVFVLLVSDQIRQGHPF